MKKLIALFLALIMLLSFAGCSESGEKIETEVVTITPERGTVSEGVYENETFGVSFEFGEGWDILSDEEIAAAMGLAAEEIYGEGAEITGGNIYDFYGTKNETGARVSINYENLETFSEITDANGYLEIVMANLIASGADSGIVDAIISNVTLGEKEVPCLDIVIEYDGTEIYQKLIVSQTGSWMSTVTIASFSEGELSELIGKISFK